MVFAPIFLSKSKTVPSMPLPLSAYQKDYAAA
ncbi:hypothetical protein MNBD_DELTA04-525 [hydrothermal vent metagenome]|uniref:Uncharacterized protein n=1 Tax=hydrothermal vent metagenome TaxID=652676 RepID=A0A3B0VV82_9ZZZZ